jgi:hypothetical protein
MLLGAWISIYKRMKSAPPYLIPCRKSSKWITGIRARAEAIKHSEENPE